MKDGQYPTESVVESFLGPSNQECFITGLTLGNGVLVDNKGGGGSLDF